MISQTTSTKKVYFKSTKKKDEFAKVLRRRINAYFKDNNISKKGNLELYLKTAFAAVAWIGVWALIMSDVLSPYPVAIWGAFTLLGFVNIFIAFNIAHDANHNAYSEKMWVNRLMSYAMNWVGGNSYLFRKMHNAHHAWVNIHGIDVTLETHGVFRFTPDEPYKKFHRFQHIYTPILYAIAGLHWATVKDFKWMFGEHSIGNEKSLKHPAIEYVMLFLTKAIYFGLHLVLPMIFLSTSWWVVLLGFVFLHLLPSLTFALIFQVTHVYDGTYYPMPDENGNIDNNYAIHVLETTADFSRRSKLGSWLMGAINIHVIHHVMPGICHVHYQKLTPILMETAKEYGVPYKENKSFPKALAAHMRMLKLLSKPDATVPRYRPVPADWESSPATIGNPTVAQQEALA